MFNQDDSPYEESDLSVSEDESDDDVEFPGEGIATPTPHPHNVVTLTGQPVLALVCSSMPQTVCGVVLDHTHHSCSTPSLFCEGMVY